MAGERLKHAVGYTFEIRDMTKERATAKNVWHRSRYRADKIIFKYGSKQPEQNNKEYRDRRFLEYRR